MTRPRNPAPMFRLTYHARVRMGERRILIADVEFILGNPEVRRPAKYPTDCFTAEIFDRVQRRRRVLNVFVDTNWSPWVVTTLGWQDERTLG